MLRKFQSIALTMLGLFVLAAGLSYAQTPAATTVPHLVHFAGVAHDLDGKAMTGTLGITFALYAEQSGGAALWLETQNVEADAKGNYTVQLGVTKPEGLPLDLFVSGAARWLGVTINSGQEQPRVLLLSVPYALKAADAETIGGLPPSAFVLAPKLSAASGPTAGNSSGSAASSFTPGSSATITGGGTKDYVPLWLSSSKLGNSKLFQSTTGNIGIGTTTPSATLDVDGTINAASGFNLGGQPFAFGSYPSENSFLGFAGNTKTTGAGNTAVGAKALYSNTTGYDNAASGAAALYFNTSGFQNTASGIQALYLNTTGAFNAAHGINALYFNTAGNNNTAAGSSALYFNGTGSNNTASGAAALYSNNGNNNTAAGGGALYNNTTGGANAAVGYNSGSTTDNSAVTGSNDTFLGASAAMSTGSLSNATAIGANALVTESNTLVLGSIAGVNGATASTLVGIGTTSPQYAQLEVDGLSPYEAIFALGWTAPSGSNSDGGIGMWASGGKGDPNCGSCTGGFGVTGVAGAGGSPDNDGIGGSFFGGGNCCNDNGFGDGIYSTPGSGLAGMFEGDVNVSGNLSKGGGSFKIDHPLDPANKYLYHSFVESPDMMNIYDGVVSLDANGEAVIQMPDWFGVLNRDFRYQLTCIGGFAPVYIAEKLTNNQFKIGGGKPGMEVSWQITGIRQDAWANAHRIPVEEEKEARLKGFYIHPELYGAPPEKQIEWARHPAMMKRMQEMRQRAKENPARPIPPPAIAQHARMLPSAGLPQGSTK